MVISSRTIKILVGGFLVWIFAFQFHKYLTDKRLRSETVNSDWVGYYRTTKEYSANDMDSAAAEMVVSPDRISIRFSNYEEIREWKSWEVESAISKPKLLEVDFPGDHTLYIHQPYPGHYVMGYKEIHDENYSSSLDPIPMLKLR
jgi:hypothetical protein